MIGILLVTHTHLGDALIEAGEFVLGERPPALEAVSIDLRDNAEKLRNKIAEGIKRVNQNNGVLILTDMFGGTPSNLSYAFLEEGRIEVMAGVNLPILMKAIGSRRQHDLSSLATALETYGKKSISLASSILKGNRRTA